MFEPGPYNIVANTKSRSTGANFDKGDKGVGNFDITKGVMKITWGKNGEITRVENWPSESYTATLIKGSDLVTWYFQYSKSIF